MIKDRYSYFLRITAVAVAVLIVLASCGRGEGEEGPDDAAPEPGWEYFDRFDPLGETYGSISGKYDTLEDSGVYDGGVVLKVNGSDLYFGFPRGSKDEIEDTDTCTSVYGTLGTVFGLTKSYASDDLEELLSLTWEQDYDEMYYADVTRPGGKYTVLLVVETLNELYSPETSVTIFLSDSGEEET